MAQAKAITQAPQADRFPQATVDSRTLIIEASEAIGWNQDEKTEKYFREKDLDMIVTSTDIDQIIKDFSDIISNAINITLHPGIYS